LVLDGAWREPPYSTDEEILLEQRHHIGFKALIEAWVGSWLRPGAITLPLAYLFSEGA
jgi:hypothetical protein